MSWVLPYLRAYGRHVGLEFDEAELRRRAAARLAGLPAWARLYAAASAVAALWLLPALLLRRPCTFAGLEGASREAYLERLQNTASPWLRAVFFGAKSLSLLVFYGGPDHLERIGCR